jgi:hypothetical protein
VIGLQVQKSETSRLREVHDLFEKFVQEDGIFTSRTVLTWPRQLRYTTYNMHCVFPVIMSRAILNLVFYLSKTTFYERIFPSYKLHGKNFLSAGKLDFQ